MTAIINRYLTTHGKSFTLSDVYERRRVSLGLPRVGGHLPHRLFGDSLPAGHRGLDQGDEE